MADGSHLDLDQLSPSQQEALRQYTQLTNQEAKDAVPLLERSQWNVQIAITKFFDGEAPDPVADAQAAETRASRTTARHDNLQESFFGPPAGTVPRRYRTENAPRVVPQPASSTNYRPPYLLAILFAPLSWGIKVLSALLRPIHYVVSLLPQSMRPRALTTSITRGLRDTNGRKMLLPRDSASRFKREFEEEYGHNSLPWFEGGFAQALDLAKRDLKFLLVVLMSPEHDDTASFARDTLLAPELVSYVSDPASNVVLWGGNVLDSEAYIVAQEYNCTKFPFSVLISLTPKEGATRMGIIKRLAGPVSADSYLAGIQSAINKYGPDLEAVKAERMQRETARTLRSEQDSAYERSLARDRERARQRREAEAAAAQAEKRAQEEAEAAAQLQRRSAQWRRWRATTIAPEPSAADKDVVRLALKMPEATGAGRVIRRFAGGTTVEELYAFVECYGLLQRPANDVSGLDDEADEPEGYEHRYSFRIASPMPRVVYEPSKTATLREKVGKSGNLIVEEGVIEDDEEEAAEE